MATDGIDPLFGQIIDIFIVAGDLILFRPGLTDCGALGKIIFGGPQIKFKTKKKKKKKKKKVTATCCSHSTPINVINNIPILTLQQNNLGRLRCSTRLDDRLFN